MFTLKSVAAPEGAARDDRESSAIEDTFSEP